MYHCISIHKKKKKKKEYGKTEHVKTERGKTERGKTERGNTDALYYYGAYAEVVNIDFTSAKTKKKNLDTLSKSDSSTPPVAAKQVVPPPSAAEQEAFFEKLHQSGTKLAILSLVEPYVREYIPKTASNIFPQPLTSLDNPAMYGKDYGSIREVCQNVNVTVTNEQSKAVESNTRQQSLTKQWYAQRIGRITASRMKAVCHTDPGMPSQSLIKQIVYPDLYRFSSSATTWGCTYGKEARDKYEQYMTEANLLCRLLCSRCWTCD